MAARGFFLALAIGLMMASASVIVWVKRKVVEEVNARLPIEQRKNSWQWSKQGRSVLWNLHTSLVPESYLQGITKGSAVGFLIGMLLLAKALGRMGH